MSFHIYGQDSEWKDRTEFERLIGKEVKLDSVAEKGEKFILAKQLLCV